MSKKYSDYNENKRKELLNATVQLSEQLKINSQQPLNFSSVLDLATQVLNKKFLNDKTVGFMSSSLS